MMTNYYELGIVLVAIGSAWGHLRAGQARDSRDIQSIKRALGLENGRPSAFVRREEWEIAREAQDEALSRVLRRLEG